MSAENLRSLPQIAREDRQLRELLQVAITILDAIRRDDDLNVKTLQIIDLLNRIDLDLRRIANYFEQGAAPPAG